MVVGAGVSGLLCAKKLSQAGLSVTVVDRDQRVGGRIQTDVVDGFRLDRGFQVLLTEYPTCNTELDLQSLNLRTFEPGCFVWNGEKMREVHKDGPIQMLFERWLSLGDMLHLFSLSQELNALPEGGIWQMDDVSVLDALRQRGFSERLINRFVRPFFGGVLGDDSLEGSCLPFFYYWSMFDKGETVIPAMGMGEVSQQIADSMACVEYRLGCSAASLVRTGDYVSGVTLDNGEVLSADAVVLATDSRALTDLSGLPAETHYRSFTTIYYAADKSPLKDPILVVNGSGKGRVSHVAPMSRVSPDLAPSGRHLVSATLISNPEESDMHLAQSVQYELRDWFPDVAVDGWLPLAVYRIPMGQISQPVGFMEHRPEVNPEPGLFLAGEALTYAGLDGALKSGAHAAAAVMDWFKTPVKG